jgi:integrase
MMNEKKERQIMAQKKEKSKRKPYRVYRPPCGKDPTTGETLYRSTWRVEYRWNRMAKRFDGFDDERTAEYFARELQGIVECKKLGHTPGPAQKKWFKNQPLKVRERLADMGLFSKPEVVDSKPIADLLRDFSPILRENGATKKQADLNRNRLKHIIDGAKIESWQQFNKKTVLAFLMDLHDKGMSKQTYKFYVGIAKRFGTWLQEELGLSEMPVKGLKAMKIVRDRDQKHPRRALTKDEAQRLLHAAKEGPERFGLSGHDRYMLYKLAMQTGLRRNELRALKVSSFKLKALQVEVPGKTTKSGHNATQPLRADTAKEIARYLVGKSWNEPIWTITDKSAVMMQQDCEAAKIKYETDDGFADFHALRHTFGTFLALAGVHPKRAQKLMRHSDIRLTMGYYTHLTGEEHKAVESLPDLDEKKRATGTDD